MRTAPSISKNDLKGKITWLITIRWIAAGGLLAVIAAALFAAVCTAETTGVIPSYPLWRAAGPSSPHSILRLLATFAAFISALYICVYFTTTIVNQLRRHESEMEISNAKLKEQDGLRSRYVMAVSHDIRGPLSGIESCLQVVRDGYTGTIPEKALEMIARASRRARHLLSFVRDLLDVSKMRTADRFPTERFPLVTQISRAAESLKPQLDAKALCFRIAAQEGDPVVEADRHAMDQLFGNLIGNAVRYTGVGGRIDVRVERGDQPGYVQVTVEDSGIGIPVESIPRVFDDFYRAGNAKALTEEGTGLGLSIVRRIVEMHGGKIWVESRLGEGTSFFLTLPLAR